MLISHTHIHSAEVHRHFHRYRFSCFFFNLLKPSTIREIFITTNHSICKISQFLWFKNAIPTLPLVSITLEFTQILITPFFLSIAYPNPHTPHTSPPPNTHMHRGTCLPIQILKHDLDKSNPYLLSSCWWYESSIYTL